MTWRGVAFIPEGRLQSLKALKGFAGIVGIDLDTLHPPVREQMLADVLRDPRMVVAALQRIHDDHERAAGMAQRRHDGQGEFRKARRKHGRQPAEAPLWQRGLRQPKRFRWRETRPLPGYVPS